MENGDLSWIYFTTFIDLFAVGLIFPALGPHVRGMGSSFTAIGIFNSTYAALQVISGPIIGAWTDLRGRKSVFSMTLLLCALCYFAMGFCESIGTLCVFRFLLGMFKHTQSLNKAIVADLLGNDKSRSSKVYGRTTSFGSLGFVVGPIIGGYLSEYENGFQFICTLTASLFLINFLQMFLSETLKKNRTSAVTSRMWKVKNELITVIEELKAIKWSKYWAVFVLKLLFIQSTTMFFVNQGTYMMDKFELGRVQIGYLISFVSIIGVITGFFMGALTRVFYSTDKRPIVRTLHGFVHLFACFIGFYFSTSVHMLVILLIPFGYCNAVLRIVTMELLFDKIKESERGSLNGASDSMMALGRMLAPLFAGFISDYFGEDYVMLYASFLAAIGIVVSFNLYVK